MSSSQPSLNIATALTHTRPEADITIYMHSSLLYWWPVWAVGFLMAFWTAVGDYHMVLVPRAAEINGNVITVPSGKQFAAPFVHVARSRIPGTVFVVTLLVVIVFSNASLRGPWALFALVTILALVFLVGWLDLWNPLFRWVGLLRVHLNLGAYLTISIPLCLIWFLIVFVFDRRTYMVFSAGQVRIRDELGAGEKVFDAGSVSFEKKQYDPFCRLVGWGAGDLVVRTGGGREVFELPNIVHVGKWLKQIEVRLQTREVE